ncbi:MAG: endo alpha-1,4 polygalactosaminidase [Acidobacteriota bacterium]
MTRAPIICVALAACGGSKPLDTIPASALPPANAKLDYQLGGAYPPPDGVTVVSRDRNASPASGMFTICYVNGFQIQPGEAASWQAQHPELVLHDRDGNPVVDPQWHEMLIDVGTADKRAAVAAIVDGWIDGCKQAGFNAIEIDNLDSYTRSQGLITPDDAVAAMRLFAEHAHGAGLPVAQKNSAELVARKRELATDFAVAEECDAFGECDSYTAGYGSHVLVIEYDRKSFDAGCRAFPQLSIVLRDRELVTPDRPGYVYAGC